MSFPTFRGAALLAAFALAAPAAFAQTTTDQQPAMGNGNMGRMGGRMGGNRQAEMMKELNLTADQQTKVNALMQEQRANMPRPAGGEMSEADRQARQTARATMDAKMKEILTPEQYTKYQAMRPQPHQRTQTN